MKPRRNPLSKRLGSALVMTLVIIVLITVVTVGYLASVMLETKTAGSSLDQERAYGIAMVGAHEAMARIREALGPWDDPYKNFATTPPQFYWSLSPGRITHWDYTTSNSTNFGLFSEPTGTTTNFVNLNRQLVDGSYPIIGGADHPEVSVQWANLLRDPSKPAGADNPIVGRYAFWVDDEGAKINVNTADGTEKYTNDSLGIGTPSEVTLGVLFGGTNVALTKQIVQVARTNGFGSPREILRVPGVTNSVLADNVFSLTAYSRSPDLNVFGQPKMALAPMLGSGYFWASDMGTNGITLRPIREIYPTPSQLPQFVAQQIGRSGSYPNPWPLAFRQGVGLFTGGNQLGFQMGDGANSYLAFSNYCFVNGMLLAKYMSGTNAAGTEIHWPVFRGASTNGFAGKYTPRQIDSIVAQICNLGSQAVSPDYPFAVPGNNPSSFGKGFDEQKEDGASAPVLFPGWLSGQWVSGMGRSPKVTGMLLKLSAFGSSGELGGTNYVPAKASLDLWVEWWLPAAFRGSTQAGAQTAKNILMGHRNYQGILNSADASRSIDWQSPPAEPLPPNYWYPRSMLSDVLGVYYWSDKLLANNMGVDFAGNPPDRYDLDPRAATEHDPFARQDPANPAGPWMGTGVFTGTNATFSSPLRMSEMTTNVPWRPGQIRTVQNRHGGINGVKLPMSTNASLPNARLLISGGIAILSQMLPGYYSEADPVPLEAIRGPVTSGGFLNRESYTDPANASGYSTVQDRALASVIPVNLSIDIPAHSTIPNFVVNDQWLLVRVQDPLVNKFPGDWKPLLSAGGPPATTMKYSQSIPASFRPYDEDGSWRASLRDPDSYWMPEIDCALYTGQTPLIPRSARLPNVGYLQYVRTGIIPDDEENEVYTNQHGTPFRLLSFAPSYEDSDPNDRLVGQKTSRSSSHSLGASQSYPDWALLDLLYVPSTLTPVGGPYGTSTNLDYYGTFGGSTAGRINPNGAVIYTTNIDEPVPIVSRTTPIKALLHGLRVNQEIQGSGTNSTWSQGTSVDVDDIAGAIESYLRTNGPFRMPMELCNLTNIANLRPSVNPTRNDLMRQIAGNLTTQGNVFSVWTVGQAIKKKPTNGQFAEFEAGDNILAEVRMHFVVERYLDPGADGVYGTYSEVQDPVNHPLQPRYLYRVIASEEIR